MCVYFWGVCFKISIYIKIYPIKFALYNSKMLYLHQTIEFVVMKPEDFTYYFSLAENPRMGIERKI